MMGTLVVEGLRYLQFNGLQKFTPSSNLMNLQELKKDGGTARSNLG